MTAGEAGAGGAGMNLHDMIEDYCRRAPGRYKVEDVVRIIADNFVIVEDGCFIVFGLNYDEAHIIFPYAARGKSIKPIAAKLEGKLRASGVKVIKIVSDRPAAFGRLFKGYAPIGVVLQKELI